MAPSLALPTTDPFAALGLTRDASPRAIKARYYQLARKYHPNTNHGIDPSPTISRHGSKPHIDTALKALSEHFHRIYDAYTLLSKESQRLRYIELAALDELDKAVDNHRVDLEYIDFGDSESDDGWGSDLDDHDLASYHNSRRGRSPVLGAKDNSSSKSSSHDRRPGSANGSSPSPTGSELRGRGDGRRRSPAIPGRMQEDEPRGDSAQRAAADRRKKLNRIKRKEVEVFEAYRDAKILELEAQLQAERLKDIYERTKAKREQIEKIPMETSSRMRMVRNIYKVMKLLRPEKQALPARTRNLSLSTSILNDEFVSVSSPLSARPGIALHRRGFSSDISGDQTDSDEETPHPPFRHPFKSPTPNGRPSASRERSPAPPRTPTQTPPIAHNGLGISWIPDNHHQQHQHIPSITLPEEVDPKFRLFVKRPTGFDGHEIEEDLSSPIASRPLENRCRELIRFAIDMELNGVAKQDTSNATTGHQISDSDSESSPVRQIMFEVRIVGNLRFPERIPYDHVHRLDISEETRLLGKPLDADIDPGEMLSQLRLWDSSLGARFMIKPDIKASFAFRLICSKPVSTRQTPRGFIALSYRRKNIVKRDSRGYTLPLSAEMMQAVWDERRSEDEGLWIDQICIDQDNDHEREVSMSAMDMVYRDARLIVVVLDDFEFEHHEVEVLASHIEEYDRMQHVAAQRRFRRHSPAWLERHEELFNVITKILSGSWFRRAWCRHEMRLAKDHTFLIPCRSVGNFGKEIIRLSSACLAHLLALATEVPFKPQIEVLKPALNAFFRDRTEISGHKMKRSHHGNFTAVAAEVFRMEAGGDPRLPKERQEADARWDRMSIILNAMECGLALRPFPDGTRQALSISDCYYSLLMLALAARDPGALCSAGKPLVLTSASATSPSRSTPSWLFEPTVVDAGLNNYKTLTRLPLGSVLHTGITGGSHWVQLDLKFLGDGTKKHHLDATDVPELVDLAQGFVAKCEAMKWGRHRRRYLIHETKANEYFGSMEEVYVQTLAGVFHCGPDWMTSVCQRYGVARWQQDVQPAYWLLVGLRNMNGKWSQKDDWTGRAASFIMDFVNFLVIRGMPQRQLRQPEVWRPAWFSTRNRGQVLTFTPVRDGIRPAIPSMLLDADYRDLTRLWILEPWTTPSKWTLLGKSVLFGDELAKQVINVEDELVRHEQTVYGRSVQV